MLQTEKNIRLIIADDNQPTRELIELYLSPLPQVQIMASVSSGQEVLEQLVKEIPTAIFLDIEMPDLNGLSAAAKIREIQPNIFIIFVTAHTQYAAEAFQLEATDYLVKPISKESIERAIKKVEKYSGYIKSDKLTEDILVINNKSETYLIRTDKIIFIEKEIRKTIIHTETGKYLTLEILNVLERKLDNNFFRCQKGFIVNIKKIEKIVTIADRIYNIHFFNYPHHATMGRKKLEELYEIINNKMTRV